MGQYYKAVSLNPGLENEEMINEWVYSHDFGSGLKLMEHSWIKNPFVNAVEGLIAPGGKWDGKPIVWAGDYADAEDGTDNGANIYSLCSEITKIKPDEIEPLSYRYLINHTKKMYVDKNNIPEVDGWIIHPLPLLTCEGNGRGGGDYRGVSEIVGQWARDVIGVDNSIPNDYTEFVFDLIED